jgi:hypothetical protein
MIGMINPGRHSVKRPRRVCGGPGGDHIGWPHPAADARLGERLQIDTVAASEFAPDRPARDHASFIRSDGAPVVTTKTTLATTKTTLATTTSTLTDTQHTLTSTQTQLTTATADATKAKADLANVEGQLGSVQGQLSNAQASSAACQQFVAGADSVVNSLNNFIGLSTQFDQDNTNGDLVGMQQTLNQMSTAVDGMKPLMAQYKMLKAACFGAAPVAGSQV